MTPSSAPKSKRCSPRTSRLRESSSGACPPPRRRSTRSRCATGASVRTASCVSSVAAAWAWCISPSESTASSSARSRSSCCATSPDAEELASTLHRRASDPRLVEPSAHRAAARRRHRPTDSFPYLVMEYVDGLPITHVLRSARARRSPRACGCSWTSAARSIRRTRTWSFIATSSPATSSSRPMGQ